MIKTIIEEDGQKFIDSPVKVLVSHPKPLSKILAYIFNSHIPKTIDYISHYERTHLQWMRPDKNGELIPRKRR